ncbi:phosphate starvation protein [Ammoniphilus oxalaticus]|uniref:Phosphate starvation protein n=1 Tax=Ammoniphilus oxalaticus TaxID=66863 RepID=A0A419SQT1_9BACL|nr:universal stress protein [Ammoniphilus oxalaticus]RKD26748.1 phosphate starvation protein [Ammoniphilus oxalaticus]
MLSVCSRIAVPYDNSELSKKALDKAIKIAKQDQRIELDILTVVSIPTRITYHGVYNDARVREAHYNTAQEMLEEISEKLSDLPNKTRTITLEGNPAYMIVEFTKENGTDLVIMGSRGLSGLQELFLGSVSHYVVQKSACPVFVVK